MVKEHPILFSTPMVQAIIYGRKTMTRRIVKPQPNENGVDFMPVSPYLDWESTYNEIWKPWHWETEEGESIAKDCVYGEIGDLLYVKETFAEFAGLKDKNDWVYKADGIFDTPAKEHLSGNKWRPSLFMPKEAARIWLEITDIKVERLQDISEEDAIKEGIEDLTNGQQLSFRDYLHNTHPLTAKASFKSLWQSINGEESWELNPYVWVLCFKPKNTILKTN